MSAAEFLPGFLLAYVATPLFVMVGAYVGVRLYEAYLDRHQPPAE
jgi:hypothetical protein